MPGIFTKIEPYQVDYHVITYIFVLHTYLIVTKEIMEFSFDVVSFFLQSCPPTTMTLHGLFRGGASKPHDHRRRRRQLYHRGGGVTSVGNIRGLYEWLIMLNNPL